jgi:hypothetical protein
MPADEKHWSVVLAKQAGGIWRGSPTTVKIVFILAVCAWRILVILHAKEQGISQSVGNNNSGEVNQILNSPGASVRKNIYAGPKPLTAQEIKAEIRRISTRLIR